MIFDIKKYAINDGPGIRTTIFFKGCPLSCVWCHNPESQSAEKQKMHTKSKCIACQICVVSCEENAIIFDIEKGIVTDYDKCTSCGKCEEVCPTGASEISGYEMSVPQLMKEIKKDTLIMDKSEGGVTFSGGEVLMHTEMLLELLKECKKEGIHTCVDTSGYGSSESLIEISKYTDLFLYDLKHMNSEKHLEGTGVKNELILKNLRSLSDTKSKIQIRIPLIEAYNDDEKNISATIDFLKSLNRSDIEVSILPYHNLASKKHSKLGEVYEFENLKEPSEKRQIEIVETFLREGILAKIGG